MIAQCYTNPMDEYKITREKSAAWLRDSYAGVMAVRGDGTFVPVRDYDISDLAFVAGFWRVQDKLDMPIQVVRDKKFVLLEKLNRTENTLFQYYNAVPVGNNCYGPFIIKQMSPMIVAKYDTDNGTMWGYGTTLEQARAFLGIALFDKNIELIHAVERKNMNKRQK